MRARSCWIIAALVAAVLLLCACKAQTKPTVVDGDRVDATHTPQVPVTAPTRPAGPSNQPNKPGPGRVDLPTKTPTSPPAIDLTAQEAFVLAERAAKAWKQDAVLQGINLEDRVQPEGYINREGRARVWRFYFAESGAQPVDSYLMGLAVSAGSQGVLETAAAQIKVEPGFQPVGPLEWLLDSQAAAQIAEAGGGAAIWEKYPEAVLQAGLMKYPVDPAGPAQVLWVIRYVDPSGQQPILLVVLDAASGQFVPQLSQLPAWLESGPLYEMQTLTARGGYTLAEQAARRWSASAQLVLIGRDEENHPAVSLTGRASAWTYTFVDTKASPDPLQPQAISIRVGPRGVLAVKTVESFTLPSQPGPLSGWTLDSPEAIAAAEAVGGAVYRQRCPDATMHAGLILVSLEPTGLHPVLWQVQYSSAACGVADLSAFFDATTGEFFPQWSQIPEWVGSLPVTGTDSAITAMEGLRTAIERARKWRATAALYRICADSVARDGRTDTWSYLFLPSRGEGDFVTVEALAIKVSANGTLVNSFENITTQRNVPDWTGIYLDSPRALQIAEQGGGADIRARYPDTRVAMCLELESFNSAIETRRVLWNIHYADPAGNVSRSFFIEDPTQRIQHMRNDFIDRALNETPISDRQAFDTGARFAWGWNQQARLAKLDTAFTAIPPEASLTTDGKSPLWELVFVAPLAGANNGAANVLYVIVSSRGVEEFCSLEAVPSNEAINGGLWNVDALSAVALTERNGGDNLRAANPGRVTVYASLEMSSAYDPHRLVWIITYTDQSGAQKYTVDASTGEMLSSEFIPR